MKGPGLRVRFDVRRLWRCPQCGQTSLETGDVVSVACPCADPPVWMQLMVQPKPERPQFARIVIPEDVPPEVLPPAAVAQAAPAAADEETGLPAQDAAPAAGPGDAEIPASLTVVESLVEVVEVRVVKAEVTPEPAVDVAKE